MPLQQKSFLIFLSFLILTDLSNSCQNSCGNITIPYPFGLGEKNHCFLPGFNLTCDNSYQPPKLFAGNGSVEILDISLLDGTVTVNSPVLSFLPTNLNESWTGLFENGPFEISSKNRFTVIGCGLLARVLFYETRTLISLCASVCEARNSVPGNDDTCAGIGCCQTSIPTGLTSFDIQLESLNETIDSFGQFSKVFIVNQEWFDQNKDMREKLISPLYSKHPWDDSVLVQIPADLDWWIRTGNNGTSLMCEKAKNGLEFECKSENSLCYDNKNGNGYRCNCTDGFEGNPYVIDGCQDIDECQQMDLYPCDGKCVNEPGTYKCYSDGLHKYPGLIITIGVTTGVGFLLLIIIIFLIIHKIKTRRAKIKREKFFKQNKGLLLQHLISSNKDISERMKIFSLEELEKSTNNFDKSRIVGQGGHGIVYKGILSDQRVAAIKKPQFIVQREIEQFINEVAILSQINHRNVVKLFGCCLETEVPLLVYEFVSNGTLSNHLHNGDKNEISLSWDDRLRIALEISRALSYLHTACSTSIFHRDIKSANVLLDDGLTAKVSDFGASRSVPVNQTAVSTAIQGTYGYLDPEYFYSGRLTEKSDVYSFGVILVELLTRERPTSYSRLEEGESLIPHFVQLIRDDRFLEILDPQVVNEAQRDELIEVVSLGETCLRLKRDERPTMKQVEMKLEGLRGSKKHIIHTWKSFRKMDEMNQNMKSNSEGCSGIIQNLNMNSESGGSSSDVTRQFSMEKEFELSMNISR
ncbi:hypothetical protein LUZ60_003328 [Juncus effusus]|nr:hypothetical protein LUZ60_003328 [Juncus effusus]